VSERLFFDSNVLVYAHDERKPAKRKVARQLLALHMRGRNAVFSTQVLQEYFVTAKRKGVSADTARRHLIAYSRLSVVQVTTDLILAAIDLHRLHQVSFWDALILRAARAGGCSVVLSEDLNDGQTFDGVRVENPFAS
jgi:predicted nucleic acid-binding protein